MNPPNLPSSRMQKEDLIDVCQEWIMEREASYLCDTDEVIWWGSQTLRKADVEWQRMKLSEAVRAINYRLLTTDIRLAPEVLVTAFQELGEVYETAIRSEYGAREGVFNYYKDSKISPEESVAKVILQVISDNNWAGLLYTDVTMIHSNVMRLLGKELSSIQRNAHFRKYSVQLGFSMREKSNRISWMGEKKTAILKDGKTPKDIVKLSKLDIANTASRVHALVLATRSPS